MTATAFQSDTTTLDRTPPNPALPSLSSMRFLAAIAVFGAHGALEILFLNQMLGGVYLFGVMPIALSGVSYFFLLSGFVLTWSHRSDDTARRFWRRRFWRIYPNHLVVFVLAAGLMIWAGLTFTPSQALTQLFLVHAWIPDPNYFNTINNVSWSLSVEVFCYLLFPVLIRLVTKIRPERLWYWAGALVTVILTVPVISDFLLPEGTPHPLGNVSLLQFLGALNDPDNPPDAWGDASVAQVWFVYDLPIVRAVEFVLGMIVARIVMNRRWIGLRPLAAAALLVAVYAADIFVPYLYQLTAVTIVPMLLLLGSVAASDFAGRKSVLQRRGMVWLGDLTYAFYLLHGLVLVYGHLAFGTIDLGDGPQPKSWPTLTAIGFLAGSFVVSLILAWLLHNLVEKPAMRRWSRPRHKADATPVAPAEPISAERQISSPVSNASDVGR